MKCSYLSIAALTFMCGTAQAHEILVLPEITGDTLTTSIESTHVFAKPLEQENIDNMDVTLVTPDGETALPVALSGALSLMTEVVAPDGPAWVVAHRLPLVYSVIKDEFLPGGRDVNPEANSVRIYEKSTKALINGDAADDSFVTQPLGHTIEIVPMTNPADLEIGDQLEVQVLQNGTPIDATVEATYDGYSAEEMTFVSTTDTTDSKAMVEISAPGYWFIRVNYDGVPADAEIDTHNMRAILSFDVN